MKKKLFTKLVLLFITFFLCFKIIQILKVDAKTSSHKTSNSSSSSQMNNKKSLDLSKFPSEETLHAFLSDTKNRINVYNTANSLNNGDSANTCVYFISEVLRQNGFNIPTYVCNTTQILEYFDTLKLKRNSDYTKLKPGNICFTTGLNSNKNSAPSHTYVFMGWVTPNKYDFAYVCDNQSKDYNNKIYHTRNISKSYSLKGKDKDPFNFFISK